MLLWNERKECGWAGVNIQGVVYVGFIYKRASYIPKDPYFSLLSGSREERAGQERDIVKGVVAGCWIHYWSSFLLYLSRGGLAFGS